MCHQEHAHNVRPVAQLAQQRLQLHARVAWQVIIIQQAQARALATPQPLPLALLTQARQYAQHAALDTSVLVAHHV